MKEVEHAYTTRANLSLFKAIKIFVKL